MAMTRCRECGENVSTEAAACPHCGATNPAGASAADPRHPAGVATRRRVRGGWRTTALLLALILVALFGVWYSGIVHFR